MSFKNTLLPVQNSIRSRGKLLDLSLPVVMGILNATPDSFYTGGHHPDTAMLADTAEYMIRSGAAILDIGGASSRPGAAAVSISEEKERVLPLIRIIRQRHPEQWISVDTYHAAVATAAVAAGADIVNDISGGNLDPDMIPSVARMKVPYIAMHMQGTPATMQQNPEYSHLIPEIMDALQHICTHCRQAGISDVILDPGFGFGKTLAHNYELLSDMSLLRILGKPLLAGISRKSMIYKTLDTDAAAALNGTTALHMAALQQGAGILRAHDVKEAMEAIRLFALLS